MTVVFGAPISPFVRKVRVALAEKNIPYDLKAVFPGSDDPSSRRSVRSARCRPFATNTSAWPIRA